PDRRGARRGRPHRHRMARRRIVVAGSGAVGASVAYHLALLGADDVVVAERGALVSGSTSRAMGGVRQQFSTAQEVVLARESIEFLASLGPELFRQVGYLFLATTEAGLALLEERRELQNMLGVPVERVDPSAVSKPATSSARRAAGATASPIRRASRARCSVARTSSASSCASTRPQRMSRATSS